MGLVLLAQSLNLLTDSYAKRKQREISESF
jgi:hypothetical protein